MKISAWGEHVVGGIDQVVHVDKVIPPPLRDVRAGGWGFLDAAGSTIIGPGVFPGESADDVAWTIFAWDHGAPDVRRVDWQHPNNANWFGAGGGVWAAAGTSPIEVYGSHLPGGSLPGAGFYTVGRDGVVVVKPVYHSAGGVDLYWPDGGRRSYPSFLFVAYNDGLLLFRDSGGALRVMDVMTGEVVDAVSVGLVFCICRGPDGLCYAVEWQEAGERTVLHPMTSTRGWVVAHGGHDFNADVCPVSVSGMIRVSTSYGAGERPNEVQDYLINPHAATIDLADPIDPPDPPIDPPVDPPIDPPVDPPIDPPVDPPIDPPNPPTAGEFPMHAAIAASVINFRDGKISNGFELRKSSEIKSDETAEIRQYAADVFAIISPNGQEMMSIQPDGTVESRLVADMPDGPGPFETFHRDPNRGGVFVEAIEFKTGDWSPKPADRRPVEFATVHL